MNNEWFQCSVRLNKTMETGVIKKVTEVYLVEALSYTEAERRFIEEMTSYICGEFEVADIKRARVNELFESEDAGADRWYKAKVAFISIDDKTGGEKRTNANIFVQATDFKAAIKGIEKGMNGTLGDWIIVSVAETNTLDVFHYTSPEQPEYEE